MSPIDDTFFSSSKDKTVRLWDLRSPHTQGLLRTQKPNRKSVSLSPPLVAIDPESVIFAVAYNDYTARKGMIKLYDKNNFDGGPFGTFPITMHDHYDWKTLVFSPDGKYIMATTNGTCVYVIDAFDGTLKKVLKGVTNSRNEILQGGFTPDVGWAWVCGSDGTVSWWKLATMQETFKWRPSDLIQSGAINDDIIGPIHAAAFNPQYCMFASAGTCLNLWIPDMERIEK